MKDAGGSLAEFLMREIAAGLCGRVGVGVLNQWEQEKLSQPDSRGRRIMLEEIERELNRRNVTQVTDNVAGRTDTTYRRRA